jgi:hypothetical protein
MTHNKTIDEIISLLRHQDKYGGYFHQEPYKGDFFRLFVAAAGEGKGLRADRLHSIVSSRAPELFDGKNWPLLFAAWPEWDYAWSHAKRGAPWTTISPAARTPMSGFCGLSCAGRSAPAQGWPAR